MSLNQQLKNATLPFYSFYGKLGMLAVCIPQRKEGIAMDLKGFVDYFSPATCILSVDKKAGGGYGPIRITTGNGKYIDALALCRRRR